MKSAITGTNAVLAFALELGMLSALCYWGIRTGRSTLTKTLRAVGAVTAGVVVWAVFLAAGGHTVHLPEVAEALLKLAVFLGAAAIVASGGRKRLGIGFAVAAVVSVVVEYTVGT
ncbi:MAG: YrdB family protein [Catenulispora sp.]|nr:YrdB family protein [Catenulispora sp.]